MQRIDYQGSRELGLMQDVVQREWDLSVRHHIGDLAWGRASRQADLRDWPTALWMEDAVCQGWGWITMPDTLDMKVSRDHPELGGEILQWFEKTGSGDALNVEVLEHETALIDALSGRGYKEARDQPFSSHTCHTLKSLPDVVLPPGFVARSMREDIDVELRAEAHALAWSLLPFQENGVQKDVAVTSKVTPQRYLAVKNAAPWRADLDWIIQAPDGTPAACCIMWYDAANKVGELEPVGTHPDYRRMGLGEAVCLSALHAAKAAGATRAIVYPRGDAAYPVPGKLYTKLGFKPYGRTRIFTLKR